MIDSRAGATAFSAGMVMAVVAPVLHNFRRAARDSFPLSHYPMFSAARGADVDVTHLIGRTENGQPMVLPCRLLGPGGMNQHRKQLRRSRPKRRAERLTARVARRVASRDVYADVATVELTTCRYRLDDWFAGCLAPAIQTVHATATVTRPGAG